MPLAVIQAFGGHAIGDQITDSAEIEAVLASEQAAFVVAIAEPERAAPVAATPLSSAQ